MRDTRIRQIARLQKLAQPYLKRKQQDDREWRQTVDGAAAHAAVLAFLIRHGKPRIDEPLSSACQRCSKSDAWKDCCHEFRSSLLNWRKEYAFEPYNREYAFEPYNRDRVYIIGTPLRHVIISSFPGSDEKQKLSTAFASAPPWLIWLTFADYTAELMGLSLPDLSKVSRFLRSKANFDLWWGLPTGAFEREPWPHGYEHEPLARTDLNLLRPTVERPVRQMTRRELRRQRATRMRFNAIERGESWPSLIPAEFLKLPVRKLISLIPRNRDDFHHASIGRPSPASATRRR
jgi:hypothetical protein